jgi:N-acetylmuramoyl-L-alanine amidase
MIICLDAGHTPQVDYGAVGNNLQEANLTGDICERVAAKLSSYACDVRQVPRTDSLNERTDYANAIGADAFISLHVNAGGGTGFESFFYPSIEGKAVALSNAVHRAVSEYLTPLGIVDRGKKFIDNSVDAEHLKNDTFLDGLSNAIAWGIVQALSLVLVAPDGTVEAVRVLQAKGVIASPDYWLLNAKPGKLCDGSYVAALIRNMAGKIGG